MNILLQSLIFSFLSYFLSSSYSSFLTFPLCLNSAAFVFILPYTSFSKASISTLLLHRSYLIQVAYFFSLIFPLLLARMFLFSSFLSFIFDLVFKFRFLTINSRLHFVLRSVLSDDAVPVLRPGGLMCLS